MTRSTWSLAYVGEPDLAGVLHVHAMNATVFF
jgi:hypothetical protein